MKPLEVDEIFDQIILREGSTYTNRASDLGGPTRFGITLSTLRRHRANATANDVKNLTRDMAVSIYKEDYLYGPNLDKITDPYLRDVLVDFGVTSGPTRAIRALQGAVGSVRDGILGEDTLNALAMSDPDEVYAAVVRAYMSHMVAVALTDPAVVAFMHTSRTQLDNLSGWINRVSEFIR